MRLESLLDFEIDVSTWRRKAIVISLTLVWCGWMLYRILPLWYAAYITRLGTPVEPQIYEAAVKYDPNNADYHFKLAQIYNYSTQHLNLERALVEYEAAARLNPYRAAHWLELARYYEQENDAPKSRSSMEMALKMDPNYAQTHWAAANLYIRLGDLQAADLELRRAADLDVAYLTQVLDLAWRFYEDPVRIMRVHVPNTVQANLTALNYFIGQKSTAGADLAWARLRPFTTKVPERFPYIEYLVSNGRPRDAWAVFAHPLASSPRSLTPVHNPSFETEPLNGGFDWRFSSWDRALARRDSTTAKDGMASFLIAFDGKENLDYSQAWHWLVVEKGQRYSLSFWIKTEGITTNEGVFLTVDGQASEKLIGSNYWKELTIPFTASSDLVTLQVRRVPTNKFDNLLKGKVWLDAFTLTPGLQSPATGH